VVLAPVLMIFGAQALVRLAEWWRARRLAPITAAALFVATCSAVLGIPDLAGPDPRDYRSLNHYLNRGRMYSAAGRLAEAAESYREAIAQNDRLAFLHFEYADVLWRLERLPEAQAELTAALGIRPEFPSAHNNLGIVLAQQGDLAAAEHAFLEASRLLPNWPDPLENLLRVYDATGDAARREAVAARLQVIGRSGGGS
jgi:tetratricopeptide (TPR) repeat protein